MPECLKVGCDKPAETPSRFCDVHRKLDTKEIHLRRQADNLSRAFKPGARKNSLMQKKYSLKDRAKIRRNISRATAIKRQK